MNTPLKKSMSDWQATVKVMGLKQSDTDSYTLYKACVAYAINGECHKGEKFLDISFTQLLKVRRALKNNNGEEVQLLLSNYSFLKQNHPLYNELMGDKHFLLALFYHRKNDPLEAERQLEIASELYSQGHDEHRLLRALINQKICVSTLNDHTHGELFFLKQRAFTLGFHDLVGNIEKAAISVYLCHGEWEKAQEKCETAINAYQFDGCPEDLSVAMALYSICLLLNKKISQAKEIYQKIQVRKGKVEFYLDLFQALLLGRTPCIPESHHLFDVKWTLKAVPKPNTIPARIIQILSTRSMNRDQLISAIWGERAIDPSYSSRLYSVINDLRHKYYIDVEFDGAEYHLRG